MNEIVYVFCWDGDREQASVMLKSTSGHWAVVLGFDDLYNVCASGNGTRHQFREDIKGQALTIIEDGEFRCTSASM